ncbi:MAG: DUF1289 domain-containing protein [Acidobacteria bacterium]|nr:DUF1289 domain-containing protein [Acidobacteriota bacterium]
MEPRLEPTPCVHVCELDAENGLCKGCHRTAEAICRWPGAGMSVFGGGGSWGRSDPQGGAGGEGGGARDRH